MLQIYKQILNNPNFGMKKTYGCCRNRDIPSLGPVTPFKPRCTGHLRHGRVNECHSRHPPFFEGAPSRGSQETEKREGDGREKRVTLPWLSPLFIGIPSKKGTKGGTFRNSFVWQQRVPLMLKGSPRRADSESAGFGLAVRRDGLISGKRKALFPSCVSGEDGGDDGDVLRNSSRTVCVRYARNLDFLFFILTILTQSMGGGIFRGREEGTVSLIDLANIDTATA